jgi:hypothetical protein
MTTSKLMIYDLDEVASWIAVFLADHNIPFRAIEVAGVICACDLLNKGVWNYSTLVGGAPVHELLTKYGIEIHLSVDVELLDIADDQLN